MRCGTPSSTQHRATKAASSAASGRSRWSTVAAATRPGSDAAASRSKAKLSGPPETATPTRPPAGASGRRSARKRSSRWWDVIATRLGDPAPAANRGAEPPISNSLTLRHCNNGNGCGRPVFASDHPSGEHERAAEPAPEADMNVEEDAEFLRAQARKCRWLADRVNARDVVQTLVQMARDYEGRADQLDRRAPPSTSG